MGVNGEVKVFVKIEKIRGGGRVGRVEEYVNEEVRCFFCKYSKKIGGRGGGVGWGVGSGQWGGSGWI